MRGKLLAHGLHISGRGCGLGRQAYKDVGIMFPDSRQNGSHIDAADGAARYCYDPAVRPVDDLGNGSPIRYLSRVFLQSEAGLP